MKFIDKLTARDFEEYPVWEYDYNPTYTGPNSDLLVRPVLDLPVRRALDPIIRAKLVFANGTEHYGALTSIYQYNAVATKECLILTVFKDDKRFVLERYYTNYYDQLGPVKLAEFLGLPFEAIFPIHYDVSDFIVGLPDVVCGQISGIPPEKRLTFKERAKLLLEESLREKQRIY